MLESVCCNEVEKQLPDCEHRTKMPYSQDLEDYRHQVWCVQIWWPAVARAATRHVMPVSHSLRHWLMKAPQRGPSTLPTHARNGSIVNMLVRSHALRAMSIQCIAVLNASRSALMHNASNYALFPACLASNHACGKHAILAYSQMLADLQAHIFEPTSDSCWKVIVAMNIAETSLTGGVFIFFMSARYL